MLSIFNEFGAIRDLNNEADQNAIASLPDAHRAALIECVKCVNASNACQDAIRKTRQKIRDLEPILNAAIEADIAANPPTTNHEQLQRVINANAGRKNKTVKINEKTRAARAKAEQALVDARAELNALVQKQTPLQIAAGRATNKWRDCLTTPSADAVTRQYIERGNKDRAERIAKGEPADGKPPVVNRQSKLDTMMAERGRPKGYDASLKHGNNLATQGSGARWGQKF
jgi:hypothetical protein